MHLRETLSRWLRKGGNDSSTCPACETSLPPARSFCPHCYMVLRPEGMADLHEVLQGGKVREDIYILRRLHHGTEEDATSIVNASPAQIEPPPPPPPTETVLTRPPAEAVKRPAQKLPPRRKKHRTRHLMTYAFSAPPPAGPEDLPSLIRWFLSHDPLLPNNLHILEEGHRILHGSQNNWTYERHLAQIIADDLRTYDSPDLLQEHLILLTTAYARTLQALRKLGSHHPNLQSPADLPEPERQQMWQLCVRIGLTATRLRVEGWIYQLHHAVPSNAQKPEVRRREDLGVQKDREVHARATHE